MHTASVVFNQFIYTHIHKYALTHINLFAISIGISSLYFIRTTLGQMVSKYWQLSQYVITHTFPTLKIHTSLSLCNTWFNQTQMLPPTHKWPTFTCYKIYKRVMAIILIICSYMWLKLLIWHFSKCLTTHLDANTKF